MTIVSDINGPNPRFILTCISTGGPATTVTWTRDSVTVTEGTETVLDDPETAQYTHTLTVTGRLGGHYTCTVANNKPSMDFQGIFVEGIILCYIHVHACIYTNYSVPIRPSMRIDTLAATSISLSWSFPSGSMVTSYEVMWQRDTTGECPDEDEDSVTITGTSYDITGLEEDSSYSITVRAVSARGLLVMSLAPP